MTQLIGMRIKALREQRGLSQEELARQLGFNDRQTLSAIETGDRRVSAEELLLAVQHLKVSLDYFTDPYILAGEGDFSWRQLNVGPQRLNAYENIAGRWIAAFRAIARQSGRQFPLLRRTLGLTRQQRYEDAAEAGERFAAEFSLGDVPATALREAMEQQLGILVLMVDTIPGISGAACRLSDLDVVLINRHEVPGRRHFDLAHELFHILTWDAMPPDHVEEAVETSKGRVEQLANSFASAVLMPARALDRFGDWEALGPTELVAKLNATADELAVTASALKWRLVGVGRLSAADSRAIRDSALRNNARADVERNPPPLFSRSFAEVLAKGLDEGQVSMRRAASLIDVKMDEIAALFQQHGIDMPLEL
jgi:Zn-dependent peptidase ImmA (M78 family)/DNA-binding XRE family transcriptional regulator